MESMKIEILTFISPHLFYITKYDVEHRTTFLKDMSTRINKCLIGPNTASDKETALKDKVVGVCHKSEFARATILDKISNEGSHQDVYYCWLIDYAILIKTDKVFALPKEAQAIDPLAVKASLNNICYLREHLELGVTGIIKQVPSMVPSLGVIQHALELISNNNKLLFQVAENLGTLLIGEVLIEKNGTCLFLTEELCAKRLLTINKSMFQSLKGSTQKYLRTHLKSVYQVCHEVERSVSSAGNNLPSMRLIEDLSEYEADELDVVNSPPLENGRRRKTFLKSLNIELVNEIKISNNTNEALNVSNCHSKDVGVLSRSARLLQKMNTRKLIRGDKQIVNGAKNISDDDSGNRSEKVGTNDSYDSASVTEVNIHMEDDCTETDIKVSPLASITSRRRCDQNIAFLPAGMERSSQAATVKTSKPKIEKTAPSEPKDSPKSTIIDDCPTIKVPNVSDGLTDDQTSEIEGNHEKQGESCSSDSLKSEIITKQDFCRLVNGCTCVQCRLSLEDDDWDAPIKFESSNNEAAIKPESVDLIIKPPKLLKTQAQTDQEVQKSEILSINYSSMSMMEKKLSCKVLVHGESIPIPIRHVAQVNIHQEIYKNISKINYKESKRIQHYTFPAITRNQHVFMVNDAKSGKTMAYLPILISFVMEKGERYSQLFKMGGGPIVVILSSNSKKCEEIYDLTRLIFNRQNRRLSLVTYPRYGNISNVDILITMPTVLATLISTKATNFKRLCHLVLEDADTILKSHSSLITKILNYGDQVLEHRNYPKSIQLILCAQHWTGEMEGILTKLNKVPMVCIGNHLEAALYGKMKFAMKFLDSGCKEQNLQKILLHTYKFVRSVIICNPNELEDVQTFLTLKGIEFTSFLHITQEEDLLYLEAVWNNASPDNYSVLVCTDDIYNTINITNAHLLIHFSLPRSWSQFVKRFSCLLENIQSPLDTNKDKIPLSSFVFIDENCEARMAKFGNFIKIASLEKELPEKIRAFFEGIAEQEGLKRVANQAELCQNVKIFGKCNFLSCKNRHILDRDLDNSDVLPKNGSIKFKILKMIDAASCSIKLLEHFNVEGQRVRKFEDLTDKIGVIIAKTDYYRPIGKAVITHLYLHKDKNEYFRCKLIKMEDFALVFLIDRGIYCKSNVDRLFKMPAELKNIPAQCYEVRFANLIPPYEDSMFSRFSGSKAQFLIDSNRPDSVMMAKILLQLGNNLWLDDVCEHREMHDKTLPSIGFQLTRELLKQGLAIKSAQPLEELYKLCKKVDIELPTYHISKPNTKKVCDDQVKPNWAFLDVHDIHEVTFTSAACPEEFYVRQNKFQKQLVDLEEAIQKETSKPFYPTLKTIEVGKCCLVKDQIENKYARGVILSIEEEEAEILCVDYGDVVIDDLSNVKHITNHLIFKLPFQSIQCSLYGIKSIDGSWTDDATSLMYTMALHEDMSTLRSLFMKINAKRDNPVMKGQNSYSVILKDGFNGRTLINNLLVDCGFAVPSGEEISDFDLPEKEMQRDNDSDVIEDIEQEQPEAIENMQNNEIGNESIDFSAFDCEILDYDKFIAAIDAPFFKVNRPETIKGAAASRTNGLPAIKAAPAVDYLTPEVYWSQTDEYLKLNIKISDVESAALNVRHNRNFRFSTTKEGKKYCLNLLLFAKVDNTIYYKILGMQICVTLKKYKSAEWPRLLHTKEKVRKIYYDIAAMKLEDVEDKVRRPLQLDISDSSSDECDDDHETPYFVCSDLDSDFDYDIPNDEE